MPFMWNDKRGRGGERKARGRLRGGQGGPKLPSTLKAEVDAAYGELYLLLSTLNLSVSQARLVIIVVTIDLEMNVERLGRRRSALHHPFRIEGSLRGIEVG